jgi:hypothetical protein
LDGHIDLAIELFTTLLNDLHETPKSVMYLELMWCHALKCDLDQCIIYAEKFRTCCKVSPSCATYWEAVFRYARSIDNNDPHEMSKATKLFE